MKNIISFSSSSSKVSNTKSEHILGGTISQTIKSWDFEEGARAKESTAIDAREIGWRESNHIYRQQFEVTHKSFVENMFGGNSKMSQAVRKSIGKGSKKCLLTSRINLKVFNRNRDIFLF